MLFKGLLFADHVLLASYVVFERSVLIPQLVDVLIHDPDVLGKARCVLLVFLIFLAGTVDLLLEGLDVLVEKFDLLGVSLH